MPTWVPVISPTTRSNPYRQALSSLSTAILPQLRGQKTKETTPEAFNTLTHPRTSLTYQRMMEGSRPTPRALSLNSSKQNLTTELFMAMSWDRNCIVYLFREAQRRELCLLQPLVKAILTRMALYHLGVLCLKLTKARINPCRQCHPR